MSRYYLVVNPHGGARKGRAILDKVKPVFKEAGAEIDIQETRYAGHARIMANSLDFKGYDGFCAIGGDGTMHEVVNGMLTRTDKAKIPIGLITGGTGNSFMHDLNCLDPVVAAKRIVRNRLRKVDVAKVDAKDEVIYAFNIVGWGIPTDVNILAEKLRWLKGQRYNVAAVIEVLKNKVRLAKITVDGQNIAGDYGFILACNTIHTGNAMKMAPLAQIDDGLIDLLVVRKAGRIKLLSLFSRIFKGAHVGDPAVVYYQVKEFSIVPLEDHTLNIDGELVGSTPIHVKIMPNAIEVLV
ncbi:MAG: diacylglycerol kinase family protein [candidate division KSB1 bacterium]|jgi:sphingosine kinase|nr:diacylglycerol kinase family protein [candidate division KSB1 bacterium]